MADQDEGTQNSGSAVATASDSSTDTSQTTGSDSTQSAKVAQVDAGNAGNENDEGNSGSSDESNGSSEDSSGKKERSRPSPAQRRISELNKLAKASQQRNADLEEENKLLKDKLQDPLKAADIKLPDYSQQENVTPEQLKQDIVNAADQIVKLRMQQYIPENNREMTNRQYRERAFEDIERASKNHPELDPDSEQFDPKLDKFLAQTYERVFKADPSYRFRALVNEVFEQRRGRDQTNTNSTGETSKEDKTSKGALRQTGGAAKQHKPIAEMSADEYKDYLRSTRR